MTATLKRLLALRHAPMFSPTGFLVRAAGLTLLFAVAHLAGWRDHVSILSGTVPVGALGREATVGLGVAYVMLYFAVVLAMPILVLAAGIFAFLARRATNPANRPMAST